MGLCSLPVIYLRPNYGGGNEDNGNLLQKVPCMHCYTQCPQPCSRPPLTQASGRDSWRHKGKSGSVSCVVTAPFSWVLAGDSQTQLCLSLCGVSGSWCTQGLFEPSKCFWQVWGLILKVISPLLPSFWGFSFALVHGASPQSHSSTAQLPLQC